MPVFEDLMNKTVRPLKKRDGTIPPPLAEPTPPPPPATIRVRIKQTIPHSRRGGGTFIAGESYDLPAAIARAWIADGLAEQDKMLCGPPELK